MGTGHESDQTDFAERLVAVLNELDDSAVSVLSLLDSLAMSGLKLVRDSEGDSEDAYRHAVEEIVGE